MDPRDVTARSLADYDAQSAEYRLRILTDEIRISPEKRAVAWPPDARSAPSTALRAGSWTRIANAIRSYRRSAHV